MAQLGTSLNRSEVTDEQVTKGSIDFAEMLEYRLAHKGHGSYASRHEILGIVEEELLEAKEAIRVDGQAGYDHYAQELLDIAVAALFGYICLRSGHIKP